MNYEEYVQEKTEVVKLWLQQTLLRSHKSVAELAEAMGFKSDSSLYKAANPMENHRLHLENLPILIKETGDFAILNEIEALFGRVAFAMPRARADLKKVVDEQCRAIKEFSEYLAEVAKASADGHISIAEFADIEKECGQAIAQLAALLEAVRLMKQEGLRLAGG